MSNCTTAEKNSPLSTEFRRPRHPLQILAAFSGMQQKALAADLNVPMQLIKDCVRPTGGTSLRPYDKANRLLIESFGVRPDSVWKKTGIPLALTKRPFSPDWYAAWRSVVAVEIKSEPIAFRLARRALTTERKMDWLTNYRAAFRKIGAEAIIEAQVKRHIDPLLRDQNFESLWKDVEAQHPILKLTFREIFRNHPQDLPSPTDREVVAAAMRYGLRALEDFYPDTDPKIEMPHDLF
jgi:hypothetical protein